VVGGDTPLDAAPTGGTSAAALSGSAAAAVAGVTAARSARPQPRNIAVREDDCAALRDARNAVSLSVFRCSSRIQAHRPTDAPDQPRQREMNESTVASE